MQKGLHYELSLTAMTTDTLRTHKKTFSEMVEQRNAGHKLIDAAKTLREDYKLLTDVEKRELVDWVQSISVLDKFVTGEDQAYFTSVAVLKKGLRRYNVEHLARYSSEEVVDLDAVDTDDDEYVFRIWKSELTYIKTFLTQYDIKYRIVD